jgi:lysozyme family protein
MVEQDCFMNALQFTLSWEGTKFTKDPSDPGGDTSHGVSYRFLKNLPLRDSDFNHDGRFTWQDVAAIDQETAARIYRRFFWESLRGDNLPGNLAMVMFDTAVNCGRSRAVKWLQYGLGVKQDGILGSRTVEAAGGLNAVCPDATRVLARLVITCRRVHYWMLTEQRWAKKYIKGWLARADALERNV